jgi:hypothetical protein
MHANKGSKFEEYTPAQNQLQQVLTLIRLLKHCDAKAIPVCVCGGYGLDALYGQLTRDHSDFDLMIHAESQNEFTRILGELGYEYVPERSVPGQKSAYHQRELAPRFKLEYATLDSSQLVQMVNQLGLDFDRSLFFLNQPNGQLLGYSMRTPTIEGVEIIIQIQHYVAKERGWPPYKHLQHQEDLLRVLKARREQLS